MMPNTNVFQQAQSSPLIKPAFVQQLTSNQRALQPLSNVMLLPNVVILTVVDVPYIVRGLKTSLAKGCRPLPHGF